MGFLSAMCFTSETKLGQGPVSSSSSRGVLCFKAIPSTSLNWKFVKRIQIHLNRGTLTSPLADGIDRRIELSFSIDFNSLTVSSIGWDS